MCGGGGGGGGGIACVRARARGEGGRVQCAFWQELDGLSVCQSVCLSVCLSIVCRCQRVFKRLHLRQWDLDSTVSVCLVAVLNVLKHTGTV